MPPSPLQSPTLRECSQQNALVLVPWKLTFARHASHSIDTIKTRIQRASKVEGETAVSRVVKVAGEMFAQEGPSAFWKGITPRVARVAPGELHEVLERSLSIREMRSNESLC